MQTIKIFCTNSDCEFEIPIGLSLTEIIERIGVKTKYTILGALVNGKYVGLGYRVFKPKHLTFFDITHPEGFRCYVRSLTFMLYASVRDLMPGAELHVLHSVSKGLYCEVRRNGSTRSSADEIAAIRKRMAEYTAMKLPFAVEQIETEKAVEMLEKTLPDSARLLKQRGDIYTYVYHLNNYTSVFYGVLVPHTGIVDVFDLQPYFEGMLLQQPQQNNPEVVSEMIKQDKMFAIFEEFDKWQNIMGVQHLDDLNYILEMKYNTQLIQIAEALHEKKISDIADMIAARRDKVRIVLISGPSSSGKTTFGKRLAVQLVVNGIRPVNLSLDNYFVNRADTPRDENGDYDFEHVEAIDIKLFNQQLLDLLDGKEIEIPKFNFTDGSRYYDGQKLCLNKNSVLIIEGTHGLTPQLTHLIPSESKFKIYVSPLASINFDALTRINTADNRLIRRIVRDYKYRGYSASDTIARWPSVRRGEVKYIYPNQEEADVMFNSALLYELCVLKVQAEPILLEVAPNSPQYPEAQRLLKFLSFFKPIAMDSIPPTSIMREFLGGSSFKYD